MRRKTKSTEHPPAAVVTMHESVPDIAFELALYRMRSTTDSTHAILNDYLKELGA